MMRSFRDKSIHFDANKQTKSKNENKPEMKEMSKLHHGTVRSLASSLSINLCVLSCIKDSFESHCSFLCSLFIQSGFHSTDSSFFATEVD